MFMVFIDSVGQSLCLTIPFHHNTHDLKWEEQTGNIIWKDKKDVGSGRGCFTLQLKHTHTHTYIYIYININNMNSRSTKLGMWSMCPKWKKPGKLQNLKLYIVYISLQWHLSTDWHNKSLLQSGQGLPCAKLHPIYPNFLSHFTDWYMAHYNRVGLRALWKASHCSGECHPVSQRPIGPRSSMQGNHIILQGQGKTQP